MILVTGATGFVGNKIMKICNDVVAAPSLRNASEEQVRRIIEESGADTIVHTAAISDIGACEADSEASYIANVQIPCFIAKAAEGRKLVCFSSDQVYSGLEDDGPYTEENVKPANIYAEHKLEMEQRVLDICPDAVMLRAEWMYDYYLKKPNYYMNIINAKESVAFSSMQYRGITYVKEVAENIEKVISLPGGSYNFGSETDKSMYDITKEFVSALGLDIQVNDAPTRHNLWMDCSKAKKYGVVFSSVSEALLQCAEDNGRESK
ncbi:SDR family oxidoreductase [Butyrivibrio sp. WCD2001]|uniref:SDR family oxidoreductase n=1 Tax=Butyrivibrio sp. WCD2001 TaxID=1280681 RepID=UPI00041E8743|nr:sugar nucleotide-binding protein [Butyrivibrio sp. WCD2001]